MELFEKLDSFDADSEMEDFGLRCLFEEVENPSEVSDSDLENLQSCVPMSQPDDDLLFDVHVFRLAKDDFLIFVIVFPICYLIWVIMIYYAFLYFSLQQ